MEAMLRAILVLLILSGAGAGLAACGARPPPADARTAAFERDHEACDAAVPDAVNKRNAKTGLAWFTSPIRRWGQIDEGMSACMQGKGWGRTRACTAAELRAGNRAPNLTVTGAGIRCTDPATRT